MYCFWKARNEPELQWQRNQTISNRVVTNDSSIFIRKANVVRTYGDELEREGHGHWKSCEPPVTGPYRSKHLEWMVAMGTERGRQLPESG